MFSNVLGGFSTLETQIKPLNISEYKIYIRLFFTMPIPCAHLKTVFEFNTLFITF